MRSIKGDDTAASGPMPQLPPLLMFEIIVHDPLKPEGLMRLQYKGHTLDVLQGGGIRVVEYIIDPVVGPREKLVMGFAYYVSYREVTPEPKGVIVGPSDSVN